VSGFYQTSPIKRRRAAKAEMDLLEIVAEMRPIKAAEESERELISRLVGEVTR
jgi:hypothetical protein